MEQVQAPPRRALWLGGRLGRKDPEEASAVTPMGDRVFRACCGVATLVAPVLLGILAVVMLTSAIPALRYSGLTFITGRVFDFGNLYVNALTVHNGVSAPHNAQYGAAVLLVGTLLTSIIALVMAVPIAVGGVIVLVERVPIWLQGFMGLFLEVLAGIPSVAYGLWGLIIFGPLMAHNVYPILARVLGFIPAFRGPVGGGQGLLTAGLILAVMIVPIIATTTRDLLRSVPVLQKEGAFALGMTHFDVVRIVSIPFVRSGIIAASLLGWARALGETMAVLMICGNAINIYPYNVYAPTGTVAANIAATLDGALTDATGMAVRALAATGLALLLITLATNWLARAIVSRTTQGGMPVGRGF